MVVETHLVKSQIQGFHAITLTNQMLSLTVIPELGGKISSIRDASGQCSLHTEVLGAQDSLEEAVVRYERYRTLSTQSTATWWLEVHLNVK